MGPEANNEPACPHVIVSLPQKQRVDQHALQRQILLFSAANYIHITHTISSKFHTKFIMAKIKPALVFRYKENKKGITGSPITLDFVRMTDLQVRTF